MAKILLLDDSSDVVDMLKIFLKDKHEVYYASTWAEANKYVFRDNMDLILIDINMPGVKGDEIAKVFKETVTLKKLNIVLSSASNQSLSF